MGRNPKKPGPVARAVMRVVLGPESGQVSGTQQVDEELRKLIDRESGKDGGNPK